MLSWSRRFVHEELTAVWDLTVWVSEDTILKSSRFDGVMNAWHATPLQQRKSLAMPTPGATTTWGMTALCTKPLLGNITQIIMNTYRLLCR